MNSEVFKNEAPIKPPLRQRLLSWKWWIYGDMNSQRSKQTPKGYRFHVVCGLLMWLSLGVYPWINTWINRHPPEFESLNKVHGQVAYTSSKNPQFILQLETGELLELEYPGFLGIYGKGTGLMRRMGVENKNVLGCSATVWFDNPRYTLWQRNRVWQIECDNKQAGASYKNFVDKFESSNGLIYWGVIHFLLMPIGIMIIFIRYRMRFY